MKLSLNRAMSFAVIAAMLLAVLVIPVSAALPVSATDILLGDSNVYNWDATKVVVWASDNDAAVIGDIMGVDPYFSWWNKILVEYNEITKTFDVTKTEAPCDASVADYQNWTLGYGKMLIICHGDCADAGSLELLSGLASEGTQFFLVGDYDAILAGGSVDGMYLTTNDVEPGGFWTKPIKPEYKLGLNIVTDVNSNVLDKDNIVAGLTDGDWVEGADTFATPGLFLVQDIHSNDANVHPTVSVVYLYEEATAVNTIKIGLYTEFASMIGLPVDDVVISTSEDGETWTEVATVAHGLTIEGDVADLANAEKGTKIATLSLDEAVTATYVKADLVYADSPFSDKPVWEFFCFTEVEFSNVVIDDGNDNTGDDNTGDDNTGDDNTGDDNTGDDNTGDDNTGDDNTGDDNTGDDNTGDDNTGDDNTGDDNTGDDNENDKPDAGDASNMIVFAILALVAVAGSAVVIRNRR